MAFIQDPRMRQRWNQISHTTEAVTETAAANIWTFGHTYINPCLASLGHALDSCTSVCLGDREDRARRARERDRGARRTRAEYTFDFYDDWDDYYGDVEEGPDHETGGGSGSGWGRWGVNSEDWDRLLAGTGAVRGQGEEIDQQPRRKRGMSYGTSRGARGIRRKGTGLVTEEEDPNVIPRTAPLGFLGRLPFKIVGSLRYKPSAANLREHPGGGTFGRGNGGEEEQRPLLGAAQEEEQDGKRRRKRGGEDSSTRTRSNTTESGDTSSSYRSRGDLFPSDGEGDEDAVPLDENEFTVALNRVGVDDRSSNRTRSSKGKRVADGESKKGLSRTVSRTVSRTTLDSAHTPDGHFSASPFPAYEDGDAVPLGVPSMEELQQEEERAKREEDEEIEKRRRAASRLAVKRGLSVDDYGAEGGDQSPHNITGISPNMSTEEIEPETEVKIPPVEEPQQLQQQQQGSQVPELPTEPKKIQEVAGETVPAVQFVPARLPHFG
ncbi:hypothetical protein QBC36DRAFT_371552 [Triangularia setosa]|uniref:Uncharacterized protein n=1 Tax=Triangularia setosa TaxID=2587417 RepID=A0AAN6WBE1_9PEZI|nr:hypothetical protein QBC36DRAFT_371552 [Podospora setosa]